MTRTDRIGTSEVLDPEDSIGAASSFAFRVRSPSRRWTSVIMSRARSNLNSILSCFLQHISRLFPIFAALTIGLWSNVSSVSVNGILSHIATFRGRSMHSIQQRECRYDNTFLSESSLIARFFGSFSHPVGRTAECASGARWSIRDTRDIEVGSFSFSGYSL
jgi:hypothetical protein